MAKHIYHYNTNAEQRYFLGEYRDLYDMISLNGNIVSHTPAGIAAFLATAAKEFFIDPQTHAFQHNTAHLKRETSADDLNETTELEFRPSIIKLASERLGEPFSSVIREDKPLIPTIFYDERSELRMDLITKASEQIVAFEMNILKDELDEESKEFMDGAINFEPAFVVSPYFYLSAKQFEKWLKIGVAFYKKTREIVADSRPVYFPLVVSKEAISAGLNEIIGEIGALQPEGILLWIDDYVEENLIEKDIKCCMTLLKGLRKNTGKILNSHGGYLSILLSHPEIALLDGVGHSINYGENRSIIPIGGGLPLARFYFPSVHSRLKFSEALGIIHARRWLSSLSEYDTNVCFCKGCAKLIKEKKSLDEAFMVYGESKPFISRRPSGTIVRLSFPTSEARQAASIHYLHNKATEFDNIGNKTLRDLLEEMRKAYEDIAPFSGDELVAHLDNWRNAILTRE